MFDFVFAAMFVLGLYLYLYFDLDLDCIWIDNIVILMVLKSAQVLMGFIVRCQRTTPVPSAETLHLVASLLFTPSTMSGSGVMIIGDMNLDLNVLRSFPGIALVK